MPAFDLGSGLRAMPATRGAQLDQAHETLRALEVEQRRLERLGFELPLARCHQRLRYWQFVAGMLALSPSSHAGR